MKQNSKFISIILIGIISVLYVFLCCYFSPHVRGSDQYWYAGDVERLVNMDGLNKTNNVFPASLPPTNRDLPRPWVQNRPVVYLVAVLADMTKNSQISWVVFNCMCLFLSAFILAKLVAKNRVENFISFYLLFILFPLNFYLCLQPLAEVFNLLLATIVSYILFKKTNSYCRIALLAVSTGLLIWQRDNFLLLLPVIPFLISAEDRNRIRKVTLFLIISLTMFIVKPLIFTPHLIKKLNVLDSVINVRSGGSNMANYLYLNFPAFGLKDKVLILVSKLLDAFKAQLIPAGSATLFFYLINILLIGFFLFLINSKRKRMISILAIFVAIHFLTIWLFQNQYRYALVIIPHLFLANFWFFKNLKPNFFLKHRTSFFLVLLIFSLTVCFLIAKQNRSQAIEESTTVNALKDIHKNMHNANILVEYDGGKCLIYGYSFSPNLVFYFPPNISSQDLKGASRRLMTNWLVVNKLGIQYRNLKNNILYETKAPGYKNGVLIKALF